MTENTIQDINKITGAYAQVTTNCNGVINWDNNKLNGGNSGILNNQIGTNPTQSIWGGFNPSYNNPVTTGSRATDNLIYSEYLKNLLKDDKQFKEFHEYLIATGYEFKESTGEGCGYLDTNSGAFYNASAIIGSAGILFNLMKRDTTYKKKKQKEDLKRKLEW